MTDALKKKVSGLLERGTFKSVLREDIPPDANVLPGRFVLDITSDHDGTVKLKARFICHHDKLKKLMAHSSQTLQPLSDRLLLSIAAILLYEVWNYDVRQAYLQSDHPLSRILFLRDAPPEFMMLPGQCLLILKPL